MPRYEEIADSRSGRQLLALDTDAHARTMQAGDSVDLPHVFTVLDHECVRLKMLTCVMIRTSFYELTA